jgi:hypothetical protein
LTKQHGLDYESVRFSYEAGEDEHGDICAIIDARCLCGLALRGKGATLTEAAAELEKLLHEQLADN